MSFGSGIRRLWRIWFTRESDGRFISKATYDRLPESERVKHRRKVKPETIEDIARRENGL